jgi:hypothetical protein
MKNLGRTLFLTLAGLLALIAALLVVGYFWINHYLDSDEFRGLVSSSASQGLGVEGTFDKFRWSGFAIYSGGFSAQGTPGSPVAKLDAKEIHCSINLSAALRGIWQLDELEIGQVQLALRDNTGVPPPPSSSASGAPSAPSAMGGHPVKIGTVRLDSVSLTWPPSMASGGSVNGLVVELKQEDAGNGWNVSGARGTLTFADLPVQQIDKVDLRLRPDRLYLTKALLRNTSGGTIQVAGEVGLGDVPDIDLHFEIAGFPLTPVLPTDWRAKFFGDLTASFQVTREGKPDAPWKAEGNGRLENARLEALPLLDQLASLTKTQEYRMLPLQTVQADFTAGPTSTELRNLVVESSGMIRVEGQIARNGDALDGKLQLGLPPGKIALLPGAQQVFADSRGAYAWTPVQIGGTLQKPEEDLTPRVVAAAAAAIQQGISNTINSATDLFRSFLK